MKSRWIKAILALCIPALGLTFADTPTFAGHVLELQVLGRGTVVGAVGDCVVAFTSGCSLDTTGEIMAIHLGHGGFTLQIRAGVTGTTVLANADGGTCLPANRSNTVFIQTATLTAANGDSISFNTVGTLCEELGTGSSFQYISDYRITGGTGRFADAVGGGNLALTVNRSNGDTFLFMHGPIRY